MDINIRTMTIEDYDHIAALWSEIKGFGIRSIDDSKEGVARFLLRNPNTSVVAEHEGKVIGSILCGHDGRQGCLYHVCVSEHYRHMGVGRSLAAAAIDALKAEHINKAYLIAFTKNEGGNAFWKTIGWDCKNERNYYELILNNENTTKFVD